MLTSLPRGSLQTLLAVSCLFSAACEDDFEPPSKIVGLRVLGVRAEGAPDGSAEVPASGVPGDTLHLEMLYVDGDRPADAEEDRPIQIAWLGGCHNPPSRFYYGCEPVFRELVQSAPRDTSFTPFPSRSSFDLSIPEDILTSAPRIATDPIHFGVSYVFFALCAGTFQVAPARAGIPLECIAPDGHVLGPESFVSGYSTLYTYEGVVNHNPELESLTFDGMPVFGEGCLEPGSCVPVVPTCAASSKCKGFEVAPRATPGSFELAPDGKNEILWASFYATGGEMDKNQQLVADRATGPVEGYSSEWRPPETPGPVRLWVTLNDERGGAAWHSFDVLVESADD